MPRQPLFAGLVVDENDHTVEATAVGEEPFYIVNDAGFRRHIPAEQVDRQVLAHMQEMMKGSEGFISEQAAKMLGQEDIFTKAMIEQQLKNMDQQFDALMQQGLFFGLVEPYALFCPGLHTGTRVQDKNYVSFDLGRAYPNGLGQGQGR